MTGSLLPAGFLSTDGNQIIDSSGDAVKLAAVNWFGLETTQGAPGGLNVASYQTMMNEMVQEGFNTIRLPFSLQALASTSDPASGAINYTLNPSLKGLNSLGVMDAIVAYAGKIGLKIVLDDHRSAAGNGPNGDGLWDDGGYTTQQWVSDWQMLATHYAGNTTIIGADLLDEPHGQATWGGNPATDWAAAATTAGDAIQTINNNWLIMVEGVQTYNNNSTWWGGNLMGVATDPITLTDPNKLVYSIHDYPSSVGSQPWFGASNYPNNLPSVWTSYWGYIYQQNIAPIFVGEYGTKLQSTSDAQWLAQLVNYMNTGAGTGVPANGEGISWAYWDWNPNSGDTGGIVGNDWKTVNTAKVAAIAPGEYTPTTSPFYIASAAPATTTTTTTTTATGTTPTQTASTSTAVVDPAPPAVIVAPPVVTSVDGGTSGNIALTLEDGNYSVTITGYNNIITAGTGNSVIGIGADSPLGTTSVTIQSGNNTITEFGYNDTVTIGNGNNCVVGPQGNANVTLGTGNNIVVAFGYSNTITVGDTMIPADPSQITLINAGQGSDTVSVGDGAVYVLAGGSSNVITTGTSGTTNSEAFVFLQAGTSGTSPYNLGSSKIHTGAGNDWIVLDGQHNTVDAGGGANVIYGALGGDFFTLEQNGVDYINGMTATSNDQLDFTKVLAGIHLSNDLTAIGKYVQVQTLGNDAYIRIDTGGVSNFTGNPIAVLMGDGGITLAQMQSHGMLDLP